MFFNSKFKSNSSRTDLLSVLKWAIYGLFFVVFCDFAAFADSTVRLMLDPNAESTPMVSVPDAGESEDAAPSAETLTGRLVVDYRSGTGAGFVVLEQSDGLLRTVREKEITSFEKLDDPFKYLTLKGLAEKLQAEAGPGFKTLDGSHFLIVYNTSDAYASWCLKLFESLYGALDKYQLRRSFALRAPELPMPVLLFSNREQFADYAQRDMPDSTGIAAYYNRVTNRVVLYDLSEAETGRGAQRRQKPTWQQIDEFLSRPQAAFNVATMVHEATHQITFNRRMFLRTGPYPLWLAEGLAMFFETPDGSASHGWSRRNSTTQPNTLRLAQLRDYLSRAPNDPIRDVIREEKFMENLVDSYAMSWGLFYYLNSKEPKKLAEYVALTAKKTPYAIYSPQERLADFESVFGDDWDKFHKDFGRFLNNLR